MMNRLKAFWIWYKKQGQLTLNEWRFHKFKPVMLIYLTYGGSIASFIVGWPVLGLRQALLFSGGFLVFISAFWSFFTVLAFLVAPFERLYEETQRRKQENWERHQFEEWQKQKSEKVKNSSSQ